MAVLTGFLSTAAVIACAAFLLNLGASLTICGATLILARAGTNRPLYSFLFGVVFLSLGLSILGCLFRAGGKGD